MKLKRMLGLFLALLLLFSLAACGRAEKGSGEQAQTQQGAISPDGTWQGRGGCYKLERLSEDDYAAIKGSGEHLVCSNDFFDRLVNTDGSILYNGYVHDYAVTEDGFWCVRETGMVDGEYVDACYAVKVDFDGQELTRFDVSGNADSLAAASGTVYIYDAIDKVLTAYSTEGTEQGQIDLSSAELEEFSARLHTGGDGSVWLRSSLQSGMALYPVNPDTMSLGPAYELPENTKALCTGTAEHPFLLASEEELSYLDPASGSAENILYWDECSISAGELSCFISDGDGFLCLSVTGLARLSPAQPSEIHPRTRLTLGTVLSYDGSGELAARFNALSSDYFVEVIDYSNGGELSREDAQLKLSTELMGGHGPDLVRLTDMDALQNAAAFADMYPMLDADSELSREDFYGLKAMETGGRLLLAPTRLHVSTFGALPELVGDRAGWTWDDYFELEGRLPPDGVMYGYLSAEFFLKNSLDLYVPHAIDWVNGTCSFDTPEFVRILQAAKKGYDPNCPDENPYFMNEVNAMMADGRMILVEAYFSDAQSFAQSEHMAGMELSYIGWPTPDGSCGSVFHVSGVSISAATDCMEGCWEFAKFAFKSTYAYKPTFEKAMSEAAAPKGADDGERELTLTKSQTDRYRKLMESITVAVSDSSTISDIVLEEAAAMFEGVRTPEETAKLIQSKLSIYVAEHR